MKISLLKQIIVLFFVLCAFLPAKAYVDCNSAVPAQLGRNELSSSMERQTFSFYAEKEAYYRVSCPVGLMAEVIVYRGKPDRPGVTGCEYLQLSEVKGAYPPSQTHPLVTYFKAEAGMYYYFVYQLHYFAEEVYWQLEEKSKAEGLLCEQPASIEALGSITTKISDGYEYWHRFTPTQSGYYQVGNCGRTTHPAQFYVYTDWKDLAGDGHNPNRTACGLEEVSGVDNFCSEEGEQFVFYAEAGENYYIQLDIRKDLIPEKTTPYWLYWDLSTYQGNTDGMFCTTAVSVSLGDNTTTPTGVWQFWQSFVALEEGIYTLESCDVFTPSVSLYTSERDCEKNMEDIGSGSYNLCSQKGGYPLSFHATAGQTIYIRWNNRPVNPFSWTLCKETQPDNSFCAYAAAVSPQENILFENRFSTHAWYQFTPTESAWYSVDACADFSLSVDIRKGGCALLDWVDNFYQPCSNESALERRIFYGKKGETYLLNWDVNAHPLTRPSTSWSLRKEEGIPAHVDCESALEFQPGENIQISYNRSELWYRFVATKDCYYAIEVSNDFSEIYVNVQSGLCDESVRYVDLSSNGDKKIFKVRSGETYFLAWNSYGSSVDYSWTMTEADDNALPAGIDCEHAIPVSKDESKSVSGGWYRFTPTVSGAYQLSLQGENEYGYADFSIYSGACESLFRLVDAELSPGESSLFYAEANQIYYISWNYWSSGHEMSWFIKASTVADNRLCHYAKEITVGQQTTTYPSVESVEGLWYKFTAQTEGAYRISTCEGDIELGVGVGSCEQLSLVAYGENYEENKFLCKDNDGGLVFYASAGKTYYIYWKKDDETNLNPFSWNLEKVNDVPSDNRFCQFAIDLTKGQNLSASGDEIDRWYRFTPQATGRYIFEACRTQMSGDYAYLDVEALKGDCSSMTMVDDEMYVSLPESGCAEANRSILLEAGVNYLFKISADEDCNWTLREKTTTGLPEDIRNEAITVYPNPTDSKVWIRGIGSDFYHAVMTNIHGKVLPVQLEPEGEAIVVDLSDVPSGMYLLNIDGKMIKVIRK